MRGVAIIGAGVAGVTNAKALRVHGYEGPISLIETENTAPYDRPPLSKDVLLADNASASWLTTSDELNALNIRYFKGVSATSFDATCGRVYLDNGVVLDDQTVVLATGARAKQPAAPGMVLRTWQDALTLRRKLRPGQRLAIIGAGLIGFEVAASAIRAGCHVEMFEAGAKCMTRLSDPVGVIETLVDRHLAAGVKIHTKSVVSSVTGKGPYEVTLAGVERVFSADLVLWCIGISRNTGLARAAAIPCASGVLTNEHMQVRGQLDVYAIGDVAEPFHLAVCRNTAQEHWRSAIDQANVAAEKICGGDATYTAQPWFWSDQGPWRLEGGGFAELAERFLERRKGESRLCFGLRGEKLVSFISLDAGIDAKAALKLIEAETVVGDAELIDPDQDLRKLLRRPKMTGAA